MGVKWKTTKDLLPEMQERAKLLPSKKVEVGVFDGEHAWLAGIHEYGMTITPKKSQYLTVPVSHKSAGKKASEFSDLWTLRSDSGELFLCRNIGKDKFEILYWLTKSVHIPERSFLRAGHDKEAERIIKQTERAIGQVLGGKMSLDKLYNECGKQMATAIKEYATSLDSPPNSWATKATKGDDNPLVATGDMIEHITWRVE